MLQELLRPLDAAGDDVLVGRHPVFTRRSFALRLAVNTSSGPHGISSTSWRCCQCEIIMMPFRVVMPKSVTKPTSEPTSSDCREGQHI